ncbi:hypothetical protein F5Y04DRAFT_287270 [Hypomontagnella monticulosa]|nr:hypothetical protein F5Y04DRAFT_287270 [Hypomontagnella monticulosa]
MSATITRTATSTTAPSTTAPSTHADTYRPGRDATIGPDGKHPGIVLKKIVNFLLDEDIYRTPAWEGKLGIANDYLQKAEKARLNGELGYSDPYTAALLKDALILVDVHKRFYEWKSGKTIWSAHTLPSQPCSVRLPAFPDHPFQARPNKSRYRQKRFDHLRPRKKNLFPQLSRWKNPALDAYRLAQENFFQNSVKDEADRVDDPDSGFQIENEQYELCITGGIKETLRLAPPRAPNDIPRDSEENTTGGTDKMSDNLREFHRATGWQRAALQQCLNLFTNHENRVINTPWRRVVLPFKAPVQLPKEIVYHARALPADKVPDYLKDPTPWFYHFHQYLALMNNLTGQQRRRYNIENWNDFQRSALPMNYFGPYVHRGLSIYDDHWLKIGDYLRRLRALLEDSFGAAPRPFMLSILRDIEAGMSWRPDKAQNRKNSRRDIMRREGIDMTPGPNDLSSTVMLIDETDAAWLRFLCEPSVSNTMSDPKKQPDQNLAILFDHRLQSFLNHTPASGTPGVAGMDIFEPDWEKWEHTRDATLPSVEETLMYINGGSGAEECYANETYQFNPKEAEYHLRELSRLGRCKIVRLTPPGEKKSRKPTHVARPTYTLHPEHRVRWRHTNGREFVASQGTYANDIMHHLVSAYQLTGPGAQIHREDQVYMLDHLGYAGQFGDIHSETRFDEYIGPLIAPELDYVRGSYRPNGVESTRQAPSWSDLASYDKIGSLQRRLGAEKLDVPEKTVQFFRNLAYRMGRTIAHAEQIENRLRYSVSDDQPESTSQWRSVSRVAFQDAIRHWQGTIVRGLGPVEFKPPTLKAVVSKADPQGTFMDSLKTTDEFKAIREGIINDCVQNRNTMYPSRQIAAEDSSGHYNDVDDYKADKLFFGLQRPSLFKWATKAQRQYQAPYTRRTFFSMTRWPVFRQRPERQKIIQERRDEADRLFPSRQRHGILLRKLPTEGEKTGYYGSEVYPSSSSNKGTKGSNLGTTPEAGTKGTTKGPAHGTKAPRGTKGQTSSHTPHSAPEVPPSQSVNNPPPIHPATSSSSARTAYVISSDPELDIGSDGGPINMSTGPESKAPAPRLRPLVREDGRYIPGPAVFPMAETLLQQIMLSRSLEKSLYPPEDLGVWGTISKMYNKLTTVEPPKVPLLPPTKDIDIPRSNPRKRPLPANYIIPPDLVAKRPRKGTRREVRRPKQPKTPLPQTPIAATPSAPGTGTTRTTPRTPGSSVGTTSTVPSTGITRPSATPKPGFGPTPNSSQTPGRPVPATRPVFGSTIRPTGGAPVTPATPGDPSEAELLAELTRISALLNAKKGNQGH